MNYISKLYTTVQECIHSQYLQTINIHLTKTMKMDVFILKNQPITETRKA